MRFETYDTDDTTDESTGPVAPGSSCCGYLSVPCLSDGNDGV